jgi:DNA-binding response OmpR family regulator
VLFLTARDAAEDKITGLTVGGDDYVTKPFSLDEVIARIRAVLRRSAAAPATRHSSSPPTAPGTRAPDGVTAPAGRNRTLR